MKNPIQPLINDEHGALRFKENKIVSFLFAEYQKNKPEINLSFGNFSQDDREQFAQLIGYSLSGFGELSYVSNET